MVYRGVARPWRSASVYCFHAAACSIVLFFILAGMFQDKAFNTHRREVTPVVGARRQRER